ncbi:hypothetical protein GWI33_013391 [Rhynchophorus ferrugineus]|uniref:Uncharacterized protein n=1 Tax=Rhynchophorus ferrugineus TaxID=354439 RepID=A0A834MBM6_RHYFE|nr:hypothetical protein GWI33_013391 [Rhynchophorus ferrugineus]
MIPDNTDNIGSHNHLIQNTKLSQSVLIKEIQSIRNQRWLANEAFSKYISDTSSLTQEEMKQLMIKAYQGCDLKYSRNYITDVPITNATENSEC